MPPNKPKPESKWGSFKHSVTHDADDFAHDFKSMFLQELSWGSFMHSVEHDADDVAHDLAPLAKEAGNMAWKGMTECAKDAKCRGMVAKYGEKAVKSAMSKKVMILLI